MIDNKKKIPTQQDTTTVYSGKFISKLGTTFNLKKYLKHTLT